MPPNKVYRRNWRGSRAPTPPPEILSLMFDGAPPPSAKGEFIIEGFDLLDGVYNIDENSVCGGVWLLKALGVEPLFALAAAAELIPMATKHALTEYLSAHADTFGGRNLKIRRMANTEVRVLSLTEIFMIREATIFPLMRAHPHADPAAEQAAAERLLEIMAKRRNQPLPPDRSEVHARNLRMLRERKRAREAQATPEARAEGARPHNPTDGASAEGEGVNHNDH